MTDEEKLDQMETYARNGFETLSGVSGVAASIHLRQFEEILELIQLARRGLQSKQEPLRFCDGCKQVWPDFRSWHDHNCKPGKT